jgi:hypothetical protein
MRVKPALMQTYLAVALNAKWERFSQTKHVFLTGVDQLPGLLQLLPEVENSLTIVAAELESCGHLCCALHQFLFQLSTFSVQPLLIVCAEIRFYEHHDDVKAMGPSQH